MTEPFDPKAFAVAKDPYPMLNEIRENLPVHWSPIAKGWVLSRYDDVREFTKNPVFSEGRMEPFFDSLSEEKKIQLADLRRYLLLWLPFLTGQPHQRIHTLTRSLFAPVKVKQLEGKINQLADDLIDKFIEKGNVEFISEFSLLLPGYVIMDLLGAPRSDMFQVSRWSADVFNFLTGNKGIPDRYERTQKSLQEMAEYFSVLIEERRKNPGEDLISGAIFSQEDDDSLSEVEVIVLCQQMMFAGHETTSSLLNSAMLAFMEHPEAVDDLCANPELVKSAVEECMRYNGSVGPLTRVMAEDFEIDGHTLRKGDRVFAMVPAANRDPRQFTGPDTFDIRRTKNRHMSFGGGPHTCLGAPLARMELSIAIPKLLNRLRDMEVNQVEPLDFGNNAMARALQKLPLKFTPGKPLQG